MADPSQQYLDSTYSFQPSSILAIALTWVFAMAPLINGPSSLLKVGIIVYILSQALKLLLFFHAISLAGAWRGIHYMFLARDYEWIKIPWVLKFWTLWYLKNSLGNAFRASSGTLFLVGRFMDPNQFALPHVFICVVAFCFLSIYNFALEAGYVGFYMDLTNGSSERLVNNFYAYSGLPTLLTQVSGSNFWLVIYFCHVFLSVTLGNSFRLLTSILALEEMFSGIIVFRSAPSKNVLFIVLFGLAGFLTSLLLIKLRSIDEILIYSIDSKLGLVHVVVFFFVIAAIIPLSMSKMTNRGRIDLISFVRRQGDPTLATLRHVLTLACLVLSGIATVTIVIYIVTICFSSRHIRDGLSYIGLLTWKYEHDVFVGAMTAITILVVVSAAAVQWVLHRRNGTAYPCCLSLGRVVVVGTGEETDENADQDDDDTLELVGI